MSTLMSEEAIIIYKMEYFLASKLHKNIVFIHKNIFFTHKNRSKLHKNGIFPHKNGIKVTLNIKN